jgi:putative SOS response-associated peptidase YedK
MAGLWSSRTSPKGDTENTYTVITTEARTTIRTVHHRMPVILDRENFPLWLDVNNVSVTDALPMLLPYMGNLSIKEVSARVNSPSHNSPDCLEQVNNRQTLDLF